MILGLSMTSLQIDEKIGVYAEDDVTNALLPYTTLHLCFRVK